jgi:hypothetical protein
VGGKNYGECFCFRHENVPLTAKRRMGWPRCIKTSSILCHDCRRTMQQRSRHVPGGSRKSCSQHWSSLPKRAWISAKSLLVRRFTRAAVAGGCGAAGHGRFFYSSSTFTFSDHSVQFSTTIPFVQLDWSEMFTELVSLKMRLQKRACR